MRVWGYNRSIQEKFISNNIEGKIREFENISISRNVDIWNVDISGLHCNSDI